MSRFLFSTFGSLGDLHPYIAVARALTHRGHQAVIATSEEYRESVTAAGLDFVAVPPSMSELGDRETMVRKAFDELHGLEYLIREMVMPHLRRTYDTLMPAAVGADLLISHPLSFTLPLVAEHHGLPWVSTVLAPLSFLSAYDQPLIGPAPWLQRLQLLGPRPYQLLLGLIKLWMRHWERPLRDLRAELGLFPSAYLALFEGQFSPLGTLALFDSQLADPQPDWPSIPSAAAPLSSTAHPRTTLPSSIWRPFWPRARRPLSLRSVPQRSGLREISGARRQRRPAC